MGEAETGDNNVGPRKLNGRDILQTIRSQYLDLNQCPTI
jgi:hypothetical protein